MLREGYAIIVLIVPFGSTYCLSDFKRNARIIATHFRARHRTCTCSDAVALRLCTWLKNWYVKLNY
jgi:hypothetical protein